MRPCEYHPSAKNSKDFQWSRRLIFRTCHAVIRIRLFVPILIGIRVADADTGPATPLRGLQGEEFGLLPGDGIEEAKTTTHAFLDVSPELFQNSDHFHLAEPSTRAAI